MSEKKVPKYERATDDVLPCGHTRAQAAWLGCTEDECRPGDAAISREVEARRGEER